MRSCTAHSKVSGARVGRVLIYVCVKAGHASTLRRLDGRPKAKVTGHDLNAPMLGTPPIFLWNRRFFPQQRRFSRNQLASFVGISPARR